MMMEKKVKICLNSKERAEQFVNAIREIDCQFLIPVGKSALEAKYMDDIMRIDMSVPHKLCIYGDETSVDQAVATLDAFRA